jgi:hypothetical protein
LADVEVTNIELGDDRISFDVDQVGVPVLVKVSYFPNWKASGADGPFRVAPNLMVVVPTSTHVSLHYGWTPIDIAAWLMTFAGIGLAVLLWRRPGPAIPDGPTREDFQAFWARRFGTEAEPDAEAEPEPGVEFELEVESEPDPPERDSEEAPSAPPG